MENATCRTNHQCDIKFWWAFLKQGSENKTAHFPITHLNFRSQNSWLLFKKIPSVSLAKNNIMVDIKMSVIVEIYIRKTIKWGLQKISILDHVPASRRSKALLTMKCTSFCDFLQFWSYLGIHAHVVKKRVFYWQITLWHK